MGPGFLIGTFAVGMAINLIIWYFISRRRSKIAKWIQVVLYVLGLVFFLTSLNNPLSPKGLALAANLVIYALYGAATYMLFRPDTAAWFGNDRVDPDAFRSNRPQSSGAACPATRASIQSTVSPIRQPRAQ